MQCVVLSGDSKPTALQPITFMVKIEELTRSLIQINVFCI
ncbi:hypothetical protein PMAG_a1644 [Pseudoalteromonas mariniglutinosa NCIMB 1770]|nr:hypothetical protein [Pseudoalteromonas mariniglutinosa NCIMB 1770]